MFFPLDAEIKVKLGDHVRACETVIADLRKLSYGRTIDIYNNVDLCAVISTLLNA